MTPNLRLIVAVFLNCSYAGAVCFAHTPIAPTAEASAQAVVDAKVALGAMTLSLRAVRSGTCRMQCEYQYDPNEQGEGRHYHTAENIYVAFDKTAGLMRYDFLEMPHSGLPNQLIVRPDAILSIAASWKEGGPTYARSMIRRLPTDASQALESLRDPFGTVIAGCMANKLVHVNTAFLDRFLDITVPGSDIISYEHMGADQVKVVLRYKSVKLNATVEYELTLDSTRGYIPVRVTERHDATITGKMTPPDVMETVWEIANGAYVPTGIQCSGTFYMRSEIKFGLDWDHVNETLSADLFSEEAFALKRGDMIVVAKEDEMVVEKIVGVDLLKLPVRKPDPPPRYGRFALILLANALAFGGWLYFLRRRRRAAGKSDASHGPA